METWVSGGREEDTWDPWLELKAEEPGQCSCSHSRMDLLTALLGRFEGATALGETGEIPDAWVLPEDSWDAIVPLEVASRRLLPLLSN